jgi:hypothetical protein
LGGIVLRTDVINFIIIVATAIGLTGLLIAYVYSFRYIVQYFLEENVLKIKLFGIVTVRRIRLSEIEQVAIVNWKEMTPFTRSFKPRLLFADRWGGYGIGRGVVLKRHSRMQTVISPQDPEKFIEMINAAKKRST